jgi:signal transduction histidine kinase
MTEPATTSNQDETTPAARPDPSTGEETTHAEQAKATVLDHLRAIHELQSTLVVEQRKDAVLRAGTLAVIELVGLECGVALIDSSPGRDAIRFGQREGRGMAQHEIEVLARSLDKEILEVRSGKMARVVLAAEPAVGENDSAGEPPSAVQARDLASVLILGIGGAGRRDGVMILGRRTAEAFTSEELAMAELLVLQLSAHYERVHGRSEATRVQEEAGAVTRILQERNRELEALIAIQSAVGLTFDSDRHMDAILSKAVEVTGHSGALLYLVDKDEQGDEGLRCVRGVGDPTCIERARPMFWRRGESPVGSVWESGEAVVCSDLGSDSSVNDSEVLLRAGYHRTMWLALRARGRNIGVLQLLGGVESSYAPSEQQLSLTVADQVATTIHDGRLLADMMRHNLELEQRTYGLQSELEGFEHQLQGIRGAIAAADGSGFGQARLEGFLPGVVALLEAEAGAVYLQEAGSSELALRFQHGFPPDQHADLEGDHPFLNEALQRNEASAMNLAEGDCPEGAEWLERVGYRSVTVIPFRAQESARGVLVAAACKERPAGERRPLHAVVASLAGLVSDDESEPPRPVTAPADGPRTTIRTVDAPDLQAQLVQAQKMESIGTLAGGIAHHFNNILACIMGYASHIKSLVPDSHPVHAKAIIIEQQSERAAELTNQLRGFARGGEGRREPVDLNALLRDTVSFLSKSIDPCIHLDVTCAHDLPAVEADPGLIRQALLNVAINARDAMPGGGRINFETRVDHLDQSTVQSIPGLEPGNYVVVELNDTGPGMPDGVVERACEPFFTTKPSGAGTGLGLSVAYGIVRKHGGHLALSSAPASSGSMAGTSPSAAPPASVPRSASISLPPTGRCR